MKYSLQATAGGEARSLLRPEKAGELRKMVPRGEVHLLLYINDLQKGWTLKNLVITHYVIKKCPTFLTNFPAIFSWRFPLIFSVLRPWCIAQLLSVSCGL